MAGQTRSSVVANVVIGGIVMALLFWMVWSMLDLASEKAPVSEAIPCASDGEEFGPCYWDADTMGNGVGQSYFLTESGEVIPWCTDSIADAGGICWGEPKG